MPWSTLKKRQARADKAGPFKRPAGRAPLGKNKKPKQWNKNNGKWLNPFDLCSSVSNQANCSKLAFNTSASQFPRHSFPNKQANTVLQLLAGEPTQVYLTKLVFMGLSITTDVKNILPQISRIFLCPTHVLTTEESQQHSRLQLLNIVASLRQSSMLLSQIQAEIAYIFNALDVIHKCATKCYTYSHYFGKFAVFLSNVANDAHNSQDLVSPLELRPVFKLGNNCYHLCSETG